MDNTRSGGWITFLFFVVIMGGFGWLLYSNADSSSPVRAIVPTQLEPTSQPNNWEIVLESGFGSSGTVVPTIAIPEQQFIVPTLPASNETATPFSAADLSGDSLFTIEPVSVGATPTSPPPTPTLQANETETELQERFVQQPTIIPQPPPLDVPLNRDPMGRDHYIFRRPIDSLGFNAGLTTYPYGSVAPQLERIHHGIDMPNPPGTTIRAAESGTVIFAYSEETPSFQNSASYGRVVAIEHEIGWNGQPVFTVYAHMLSPIVKEGDYVRAGDPIGLTGDTGRTTGSHLHFEVRIGEGRYGDTYNPLLWLAPYTGHGTIAGRLVDDRDRYLDDVPITIRDWRTNITVFTTNTYIFDNTVNQVNSDPNWDENFAVGDVPVGVYEVIAIYNGIRISQIVEVKEGRTAFVELEPDENVVIQPITPVPTEESGG